MKKSQISIEFIFAFGVILIVFLILYGFTVGRDKELKESREGISKENDCLLASSLLTSAFVNGEGLLINFSMGYNATINITNVNSNYKGIDVEGSYCLLQVKDVPSIRLKRGNILIRNENNFCGYGICIQNPN